MKKLILFFQISLLASLSWAQPCLSGWSYRMPVMVTDMSGSSNSNVQVALAFNGQALISQGKMNSNGSDIRLLSKTGTLLDFWVEPNTINSANATVWYKQLTVAGNSVDTVYMFYGNNSASSASNGIGTFDFYEDFSGVTINTSTWDTCNGGGNLSVSNGQLMLSNTGATDRVTLRTNATFNQNLITESYLTAANNGNYYHGFGNFSGAPDGYANVLTEPFANIFNSAVYDFTPATPCNGVAQLLPPNNTGQQATDGAGVWGLAWPNATTFHHSFPGGADTITEAGTTKPANYSVALGLLGVASGSANVDWVMARKYISTPPAVAFGAETVNSFTVTVSGNSPLCAGDSARLMATANTNGIAFQWSGPNGFSSTDQNPVFATTSSNQSGWYVALGSASGGCSSASDSVFLNISAPSVAGTLTGEDSVCSDTNGGVIRLAGQTGNVVRWEFSNTGAAPWSTIANTSDSLNYSNLTATTFYRAIISSGACPGVISNAIQIRVDEQPVAGNVVGTTDVCAGTNSAQFQLLGAQGMVRKWQSQVLGATGWQDIFNITDSLLASNVVDTTQYRAVVGNGVCPESNSQTITVSVNPLPMPAFNALAVCEGQSTNFTNQSQIVGGSISSYQWNFADGSSSSLMNPTKIYSNANLYLVTLTATSDNGCSATATDTALVNANPMVSFTNANNCLNTVSNFTNGSSIATGTIGSYKWYFGNGDSATTTNASNSYATAGSYNVTLTAISGQGCMASQSKTQVIHPKPNAAFTHDTVPVGSATTFFNNSSISSGNLSYNWSLGDGNFSTANNLSYTYGNAGTYTVILIAASNFSCGDTIRDTILVAQPPIADFSVNSVCQGDTTIFANASLPASGLNYSWSFGDGNISTLLDPKHVYAAPGTFSATLTISNQFGATDMITKTVVVFPNPVINFAAQNVCDTLPVQFQNFSVIANGSINYTWDLGDGTITSDQNPSRLYGASDIYNIMLSGVSNGGCVDTARQIVQVFPRPVIAFSATTPCEGEFTQFSNTTTISTGTVSSYLWDFGDQSNGIVQNPTHRYDSVKRYIVNLQAVSEQGCGAMSSNDVSINEQPIADFSATSVCFGTANSFSSTSSIVNGNIGLRWMIGDSIFASQAPSYVFDQAGLQSVNLVVTSNKGCQDSIRKNVTVYAPPQSIVFADEQELSKGFTTTLYAAGGQLYAWSPTTGLTDPFASVTIARPFETTEYKVEVVDSNGCSSDTSITITINEDFQIEANNVLTPDGNEVNDAWVISNIDAYENTTVKIYDRLGNLVYDNPNYANEWAGTNTDGEPLTDGTYYYVVTFEGAEAVYKGAVTVLRNR